MKVTPFIGICGTITIWANLIGVCFTVDLMLVAALHNVSRWFNSHFPEGFMMVSIFSCAS